LVDFDNVLPDDAPGANVQVADLRVAHEALLEANGEAVSLELDKVVLVPDGVHVRGVTVEDGIALFVGRETPAVVNATRRASQELGEEHGSRALMRRCVDEPHMT
jgi:hypothetical protein